MNPEIISDRFKREFGRAPELLVRAPGRINVIGEHTDYNEGLVLPGAIDRAIYFAVSARDDQRLELVAADINDRYSGTLSVLAPSEKQWPDYLLGVFSELQAAGYTHQGVDLVFGGDIPSGAGMSSSAAIETGLLFALNQMFALGLFRQDLVKLAQLAENNFVGMQCGIMDMFASVMGRDERVIRLDCRTLEFDYFPVDNSQYAFVLCNSGVKHALVNSEYNTRRMECEEGVALLTERYPAVYSLRDVSLEQLEAAHPFLPDPIYQRCWYVINEIERVEKACTALEHSNYGALGELMYQSHEGLQHDYEVSCRELDFLVAQARQQPYVLGARMMGGGFGGCSINLVEKEGVDAFQQTMKKAYQADFGIDMQCYAVSIGEGVGEVD